MKVMLHVTRMSSGAKKGENIVTHCARCCITRRAATSWGMMGLWLSE